MDKKALQNLFNLDDKVAIITGGAGTLGEMHAEIIAEAGGIPVLVDILQDAAEQKARRLQKQFNVPASAIKADIANEKDVQKVVKTVLKNYGHVDILINNAANNPKVKKSSEYESSRLEHFSMNQWQNDLSVGLTGAFVCSKIIGEAMAAQESGVIINISSDLGVIAPDQRLYRKSKVPEERQPVKPVSYSVIKSGLLGLTRYLATYWAEKNIRVNALSPGGVYEDQPNDFVQKVSHLIPLGRMARKDEYKGAILFLCSDASSYMTGANLIVDGGRTIW